MALRTIELTDETIEIIRSLRRDGEELEETIKRLALAFRAGGFMSYDPTTKRSKKDS